LAAAKAGRGQSTHASRFADDFVRVAAIVTTDMWLPDRQRCGRPTSSAVL